MKTGFLNQVSCGRICSSKDSPAGKVATAPPIEPPWMRRLLNAVARRPYPLKASTTLPVFLGAATLLSGLTAPAIRAEEAVVTNNGRFQIPFDVESDPGKPIEGFAVLFGSKDGGASWEKLQSVPAAQKNFSFAATRDGHYAFAIRMSDGLGNLSQGVPAGTTPELEVVVDTVPPNLKVSLFESGPGEIIVDWSCTDYGVAPDSLALEYTDGADGRWKPVSCTPGASGQAIIRATPGSVVSVRASISDFAGNRAEASSQLVGQAAAASNRDRRDAPESVPAIPAPLGANPFTGNVPATIAPAAAPFPVPRSLPSGSPEASSMNVPAGNPGGQQLVGNQIFDLDYQVEDVGPSGVSTVELFVTENGGQQWFRYGNDQDLRSPMQVDTQGEGTFGFAIRVRNGLGFADAPPQPGQAPEIVVTVDQTAPLVELAQPAVRVDGFAAIQFSWRTVDAHPAATSVRLEFATSPNGPWSSVFDWQADQGSFQWSIRQETPPVLYFRLLARDAAGNVASTQTTQPVVVDLKKPVGRLLRVQSVSQSNRPSY